MANERPVVDPSILKDLGLPEKPEGVELERIRKLCKR